MAIPESQLQTWSHQGSIVQSADTYASIKNALESPKALYTGKLFKVFLQGSYGNDTNIYAESDVDIVIRLDSIWRSDLSALPPEQQAAYHQAYGSASYKYDEFKRGVITRLNTAFGDDYVNPGNKAIKINANGSRRNADVVTCYSFKRYVRFINVNDYEYVPGIIFPTTSSGEVKNYPQLHSDNITAKHQSTNAWFKPMIRILKNMRSKMVDDGVMSLDSAPSYYIEGLFYNVPDESFGSSYGETFCNCLNWLLKSDRSKWKCANGLYLLLGDGNVQWSPAKCDEFLNALLSLWNNW